MIVHSWGWCHNIMTSGYQATDSQPMFRQWVRCRWVEFGAQSCLRSNPCWEMILDFVQTSWSMMFFSPMIWTFWFWSPQVLGRKSRCCLMVFSWKNPWNLTTSQALWSMGTWDTEAMRWFPFLFMSLQQLFNVGANVGEKRMVKFGVEVLS